MAYIAYEIIVDREIVVVAKDGLEQETAVPVVRFSGSATGNRATEFVGRFMALAAEFHDPRPPVKLGPEIKQYKEEQS